MKRKAPLIFPELPFAKDTLSKNTRHATFSAHVTAQRITCMKGRKSLLDEELKSQNINSEPSPCKAAEFIKTNPSW